MSGDEDVDSFEDFDFEDDFDAVRLQVCNKRINYCLYRHTMSSIIHMYMCMYVAYV